MLEQLRLLTDFEFQTHNLTLLLNPYPIMPGYLPEAVEIVRIVAARKPPRREIFIVDADDTDAGYAEMWRQLTENNGFSAQNPT